MVKYKIQTRELLLPIIIDLTERNFFDPILLDFRVFLA